MASVGALGDRLADQPLQVVAGMQLHGREIAGLRLLDQPEAGRLAVAGARVDEQHRPLRTVGPGQRHVRVEGDPRADVPHQHPDAEE